jgi:NADH-quinone oxidoreductase subunit F
VPEAQKIVTRHFGNEAAKTLDGYERAGGYAALKKAMRLEPQAIVDEVKKSVLRGRGGAGFSTGMKWSFIPKDAQQVYLVVNADEGEPGTFKDRWLLYWDPHLLIEGSIIAARAIRASHIFVYVRGELVREHDVLQRAVDQAYARGFLGKSVMGSGWSCDMVLHRGAGAYICGEETALLNSLEGRRGWPRLKPPFPAVKGLFGQPTIVNNVETLMNVPFIVENGGDAFLALGCKNNGGLRILCVSGHIERPGIYELPMGVPLQQVIDRECGGVLGGRKLKGVIPGGSSMPVLLADECDVPMDFDSLMTWPRIRPVESKPGVPFELAPGKPLRTMGGSGGVVVMDETTDMVAACARIMRFYAHESCGQCTPCREGTGWLAQVCTRLAEGSGRPGDPDLLASIAFGIAGNTICPLGEAAAWPMMAFLTKFRDEFAARVKSAA